MTTERNPATNAPGPVYICHGATGQQCHVLKVFPEPDSFWVGYGVSFHDIAGGDGSSIVVNPAAGEYRKFESTGVSFELDCAADGKDGELQFRLRSEYSANAYPIELRLGDYLRKLITRLAPPEIVPQGHEVKIQVDVESSYISGKLVGNVPVEWWKGEVKLATVPSSTGGTSEFLYTAQVPGDDSITAKVHSPYNDTVFLIDFPFKVLSGDPWKDARWLVNDEEVSTPIRLLRGQSNRVKLIAPELKGSQVKLGSNNAEALKIVASPGFGQMVLLNSEGAAEWTLAQSASLSGFLDLAVESELVSVSLEETLLVMSDNLADEADVKIDGISVPADGHFFYRGQARTVELIPKTGSPLSGWPVALTCAIKSGLDPANVTSQPAFGSEQTRYQWSVRGATKSGRFQLSFSGRNMTIPLAVPISTLISNDLNHEVTVLLDGEAIPAGGVELSEEQAPLLTLSYKNDDLVKNLPLALDAVLSSGLNPGDVSSVPGLRQLTARHEWKITLPNKDGVFRFKLYSEGEEVELNTPDVKIKVLVKGVLGFLGRYDAPLPFIKNLDMPENSLLISGGLMLLDLKGAPLKDYEVIVTQPDYSDQKLITNNQGRKPFFIAQLHREVGYTFEVHAIALVEGTQVSESLLVTIVDPI